MKFKNFRIQIIVRLIFITVIIFLSIYYYFIDYNYIRLFFLLVSLILILFNLFYYINRTNVDLKNFLLSILNDDFTTKFPEGKRGVSYQALYKTFNDVNERLKILNRERESQYQYLSTLIHQIDIAIISFDRTGYVQLINTPFEKLVGKQHLVNIKELNTIDHPLYETLNDIESGKSSLLKIKIDNQDHHLSVRASIFKLKGKTFKLVSLQDIKAELEVNEVMAWQKLIRVLTHEIMNSVSPITSLSSSLYDLIKHEPSFPNNPSNQEKMMTGLEAIQNRSNGLMNFTKTYRKLTRIPLPKLRPVQLTAFFSELESLIGTDMDTADIKLTVEINGKEDTVMIDSDLMQQAVINLVNNAMEAIIANNIPNGEIHIIASGNKGAPFQLSIRDNGGGIQPELLDKLFVPFFTTKQNGSGIGLSLVKQIVTTHGGYIYCQSWSNNLTQFVIEI